MTATPATHPAPPLSPPHTEGRLQVRPGASSVLGTLPAPVGDANHRAFNADGIHVTLYTMWVKPPGSDHLVQAYFAQPHLLPILEKIRDFEPAF